MNGQRQGLVLEKPFRMGDTIAKELASSEHSSSSSSSTVLDIEAEIKLAFDYSRRRSVDSASFAQEMKDLGLERYYSARNASVFLFFLSFSRFY